MQITMKTKALFFDREMVKKAVGEMNVRAMGKIGAFIQRKARSSLRRRKATAPPGKPPSVHSTDRVRTLKNILFAFDPSSDSLVVGPVGLPIKRREMSGGPAVVVPGLMEHGGTQSIREVRWPGGKWYPTWGKLRIGQVSRLREARYAARPFMLPALESEGTKLPEFLSGELRAA